VGVPPIIEPAPKADVNPAAITSIQVLAVSNTTSLVLDGGPNSPLAHDTKVAEAIQKSGHSGSQILGYDVEGTSLTVYVKAT
jgi:hypothetical protein